ncbi:MAG: hypothetical protein HDS11_04735 [Bacteroides sp.]|nr:hypothetical protein [Bacteroides sp.]MBD5378235.1 hypothetical protein [Bacteroides sp.]
MKKLPLLLLNFFFIGMFCCSKNGKNIMVDLLTQYRDTIVGKFNGIDIDTLISEPIDTIKERAFWDWRIYSKNNTVDTLILTQRFSVKMIQEGDLDGNGTDEFGIRRESDAGTWDNYYIYTFQNGEWKYLTDPIWTYSEFFYEYYNNGNDIAEKTDKVGFIKIRYDLIIGYNGEEASSDTIISVNPQSIK